MSKKGIDVSYANGSINWSKAKNDIDFAIIRSSFGSDLPSQTDNFFFQNANGCVKNGIPFGIYHFAYFVDTDTAIAEASFAIRLANEYKEYVKFIALDIEEASERYAERVGKRPNWTDCTVAFLEKVRQAGYTPLLYSNQSWLVSKLNYDRVRSYKLWYAAPGASSPKYSCSIWQNSWKGRVNGIIGDVDTNVCFDDALFSSKGHSVSSKKKSINSVDQVTSSKSVDYIVVVTAISGLNIRRGASTSYEIIGAIPCGTQLRVTRTTSGGGFNWGLVTYGSVTGWIALDYTKPISAKIEKGTKVRVKSGAKVYGSQQKLSNWVYASTFTVMELVGDRAVIGLNGQVTSAVNIKDLNPAT